MDTDSLVKRIRSISDKIIEDHKSVSLIMLFGNNYKDSTTAFDYIISAKWLDNLSQDQGIDLILDYLYDSLTMDELKHLSRVTIIRTSDPMIQSIAQNFGFAGGIAEMIDNQFNNLIVPYSIIFESHLEE